MGNGRFTDLQTHPLEVLDWTSRTLEEFRRLVPPFQAAFPAQMAPWGCDGQPRTARRDPTAKTCPRPTPEDRLVCLLPSLNPSPRQVVQGRLFGMEQSQAHPWLHRRCGGLKATLRALGDAPSRSLQGWAQGRGVTAAEAAALVVPTAPPSAPAAPLAAAASPAAAPLVVTRGGHGASRAPRTRLSRRAVIVARKQAIR